MSTTEDRRFAVLRAIIADYVASQEPVGSKSLTERYNLGVSSATVRNDMAVLEAEGYIAQQHASSGRVPTDAGYRHFVDRLAEVKPLSKPERTAIVHFLETGIDLEDILRRSVQLLAQLTRQVAVIQYPVLSQATVRHLEVVSLSAHKLLLVVITDTGRVDQRTVELSLPISDDDVCLLRNLFASAVHDKKLADASAAVTELANTSDLRIDEAIVKTASLLVDAFVEHGDERFVIGGAANLTHNVADFSATPGAFRSVLEALEEQVVLLKLFSSGAPGSFAVRIGNENKDVNIQGASVVSTGYGNAGTVLGNLGVVGPTRMDYPGTISSVLAVAHYVGEVLDSH